VVGSQGRSALGRFFLGSVSKAVATEAECSVRVVRPAVEKRDEAPLRIIVGVDGSPGAARAVRATGRRVWPEKTEVQIIAVDDGASPTRLADINPGAAELIAGENEGEELKARLMLDSAAEELRTLALTASTVIKAGDPQTVLIEEAREWAADCIFVGALGFDAALRRSGLGSVATGLVTNAPCTVEIVR
jgi:nucleotide-binding universal stress UspA family protein